MTLFRNIRFYILCFSVLLSVAIFVYYHFTIPDSSLQTTKIVESYALTALAYLYLALLATPITKIFTFFPWRAQYIKARRAIGVSVFYFATLHATLAFFIQLGGFGGLPFLSGTYILAISLSFTALVIVSLMAATSFDYMIEKLTFARWKMLHRFVYLAAIFIIIHALLLGSHFQDLSSIVPQIAFGALAILLFLEAYRFDNYLQTKFLTLPKFGFSVIGVLILVVGYAILEFTTGSTTPISLGIHAAHIQIAKEAQQSLNSSTIGNI